MLCETDKGESVAVRFKLDALDATLAFLHTLSTPVPSFFLHNPAHLCGPGIPGQRQRRRHEGSDRASHGERAYHGPLHGRVDGAACFAPLLQRPAVRPRATFVLVRLLATDPLRSTGKADQYRCVEGPALSPQARRKFLLSER